MLTDPTPISFPIACRRALAREDEYKLLREAWSACSEAESIEELGAILLAALDELWQWDAVFLSVRKSGYGWFHQVFEFDTIDGVRMQFEGTRRHRSEYRTIRTLQNEGFLFISRDSENCISQQTLTNFGDKSRQSKGLAIAPLVSHGHFLGILSVQSYTPGALTVEDAHLLRELALATAPHLWQLIERRRAELFANLCLTLAAARNFDEAVVALGDTCSRLLEWDACRVERVSGQKFVEIKTMGDDSLLNGLQERSDLHTLYRRLLQGDSFLLNNKDDEGAPLAAVPVRAGDQVVGCIWLASHGNAYDPSDLKHLQNVADLCSGTMQSILMRQALGRSEAELRGLFQALDDIVIVFNRQCECVRVAPTRHPHAPHRSIENSCQAIAELLPAQSVPLIHDAINQCFDIGQPVDIEYNAGRGREKAWYMATAAPLGSDQVALVVRDRTLEVRTAAAQTILDQLSGRLNSAEAPHEAGCSIIEAIEELFSWDYAAIYSLQDDGGLKAVLEVHLEEGEFVERSISLSTVFFQQMLSALVQGARLTNSHPVSPGELPASTGGSSMLVPMRRSGEPFALVAVASRDGQEFTADELSMLQTVADHSSNALHRTFTETALRRSEERLRLVLEQMPALIWTTDTDLVFTMCIDTGFEHLRSDGAHFEQGVRFCDVVEDGEDSQAVANHQKALLGESVSFELELRGYVLSAYVQPLRDNLGRIEGVVGVAHDISDRKRIERQLHYGAFYDSLTDLPNRNMLLEWLNRSISHASRRANYVFAVLFLDLDRFKNINDSLGHAAGDRLLVEVARRLRKCLYAQDVIARIGGDEFAVFLDDVESLQNAANVAERIIEALENPFGLDGHMVYTGASIGIALSSSGYSSADDMLRDADLAMYRAKAAGKGRYEVFDHAMHDTMVHLMRLESELRKAVEQREFVVYYQPIVNLETGRISSFESLVRWNHPVRGVLVPLDFLGVAEETGVIVPMTMMVMREACRQLQHWRVTGVVGPQVAVSVNMSPRLFREASLLPAVEDILSASGLPPECLKLEITESTAMQTEDLPNSILLQLRALNVQMHIDDFGTGYSSLSYLSRFPIDALKIDQSFVRDLGRRDESLEIVRAITSMAQSLGMDAVAEGIETQEQVLVVKALGCRLGQGHFYSAALSAADMESLIASGALR